MVKRVFGLLLFISLISGCYIKTPTYYDLDDNRIVGNSNIIYKSENITCIGTFHIYQPTDFDGQTGIALSLDITKNQAFTIEQLQVKIKSSVSGVLEYPVSLRTSNTVLSNSSTERNFDEIAHLINNQHDPHIDVFFNYGSINYDTLFLNLSMIYKTDSTKENHIEVNRIYQKGLYTHPVSR